jgi:hypothetical protein
MQEAVEFLEEFVDVEYEALRALVFEADCERFQQRRLALEMLAAFPGLAASVYRAPQDALPAADEAERRMLTQGARRLPFLIESYDHPERGTLYVAYLSSTLSPMGDGVPEERAAVRLTIGATPEGLRILAWENACVFCGSTGTFGGDPCPECGGYGWKLTGGVLPERMDGPVTIYRFERDDSQE